MDKKILSFDEIESQAVLELPDREMMALVNVTIFDVLNNNTVVLQLPIGIAANVCNISANVLATNNTASGAACTATSMTTADLPGGVQGGKGK